jgi:hypothetical protein
MQVSKPLEQYIFIRGNMTWDTPMAVTSTMAKTPKAIHHLSSRAAIERSAA